MRNRLEEREYLYARKRHMDEVFRLRGVYVYRVKRSGKVKHALIPRVVSTVAVAFLLMVSTLHFERTIAYFNDTGHSVGNVLSAIFLDFSVAPEGINDFSLLLNSAVATTTVFIPAPQSVSLQYTITAQKMGGVDAFCNAIAADGVSPPVNFSGALLSLAVGPFTYVGSWPLQFTLTTESGIANGDTCDVDLVYAGWQENTPQGQGYQDEERIHLHFVADIPVREVPIDAPLLAPQSVPGEVLGSETGDEPKDNPGPQNDPGPQDEPPKQEHGERGPKEKHALTPPDMPVMPTIETPPLPDVVAPSLPDVPPEAPEIVAPGGDGSSQ